MEPATRPATSRHRRVVAIVLGLVLPVIVVAANLRPIWDYTVDDSFISFRYARNLARGDGLTYNPPEHAEGYSNFAWTVMLAGAARVGLPIVATAKVVGGASVIAVAAIVYRIAELTIAPAAFALAPWLVASSITLTAFGISGLETVAWVMLLYASALAMMDEKSRTSRAPPASAWLLGIAMLVRPETPLFGGILILGIAGWPRARRDLWRIAIPASLALAHLAFRRMYYGEWLPLPFLAKAGHLENQVMHSGNYLATYATSNWPILLFAVIGFVRAIWLRQRVLITMGVFVLGVVAYVATVGGDWMVGWRFIAPAEPALFVLANAAIAPLIFGPRPRVIRASAAALLIVVAIVHGSLLRDQQRELILRRKREWDRFVPAVSSWLKAHRRGVVAIGDIGEIGWLTDYPIFDILGLVTPSVAHARFATTDWAERVRELLIPAPPLYIVHGEPGECKRAGRLWEATLTRPPLDTRYDLAARLELGPRETWCIEELDLSPEEIIKRSPN